MENDVVNVVNADELHFLHFWLHLVGSAFPNQGLNLCPLHCKQRVLTPGLPGNSLNCTLVCVLSRSVMSDSLQPRGP